MKLALALYLATASAFGAAFTNGSFETNNGCNPPSGSWILLGTGSTCMTGWAVSQGNVDYSNALWVASNGTHSVDLNGETVGGVSQIFDTNASHSFLVTFDMAGNIAGLPVVKTLTVSAAGTSQAYSFDSTGRSYSNMGWVTMTFTFNSDSSGSTTLQFLSTSIAGCCTGPVIDNVTVIDLGGAGSVPEPWSVLLVGPALVFLALARRWR